MERQSNITPAQFDADPVLERWYEDPYYRPNTHGKSDTELRRDYLTQALRQQGIPPSLTPQNREFDSFQAFRVTARI